MENPSAAATHLETPDYEQVGKLSPDGRWFACLTNVGDDEQVRIYSMQTPGVRYQLVLQGTPSLAAPLWSGDGHTLIVVDSNRRVIAVPIQLDGGFRQGEPRELFELPRAAQLVAVAPDLRRFLVSEFEAPTNSAPLCVLTSWPQRLANR